VARTKSFDPDIVLRKAMQLFWRQGFEGCSVDDLVAAMGINRASLYATFGDKHRLYLKALDRYLEQVLWPRLAALERAASPVEGLRALLAELVDFAAGDPQRRGCFAVNAACELGARDAEVAARLNAHAASREALVARRIEAAQASGEIASPRDPRDLARLLLAAIDGLRVRSKLGAERAALEAIAGEILMLVA
jgi:TetR/AcrR family transcriptional repressor of nem operon